MEPTTNLHGLISGTFEIKLLNEVTYKIPVQRKNTILLFALDKFGKDARAHSDELKKIEKVYNDKMKTLSDTDAKGEEESQKVLDKMNELTSWYVGRYNEAIITYIGLCSEMASKLIVNYKADWENILMENLEPSLESWSSLISNLCGVMANVSAIPPKPGQSEDKSEKKNSPKKSTRRTRK